jgi:hypothetical protein
MDSDSDALKGNIIGRLRSPLLPIANFFLTSLVSLELWTD